MGDDGYGPFAHYTELFRHGFPDCLRKVFDFWSVIIQTEKRAEVGMVDRPKPSVLEDLIDLLKKKVCHVDLIFQVVLLGGFAVVTDLPKVEGTFHPSSLPKDWHTRRALLSPSS